MSENDYLRKIPLSEVAVDAPDAFVDGPFGSNLKSSEYTDDGVRLIQLQNIGVGQWLDFSKKFVSKRKLATLARHAVRAGDIAIAKMAEPVARACVVPPVADDFIVVADCIKLRVDEAKADPRFVVDLLNSYNFRTQAERKSIGTTRIRINLSVLKNLEIAVPSLAVQHRISEILDTVDEAIRSTKQLIAKLEKVKRGLLHDLLTCGFDSNGRLRACYTREPGLYRDTWLGPIPMDWTVHLLDEVSVRGSGHTPNKNIAAYWNGGIKWVSLADSARLDQIYITETDKEISDLGIANSSAVRHRAGTVILSRDAGVGKSAILTQEMAVSQHFMAWACGEALDNHYLYYWLQFMKPRFEAIAMGSTIKTIGLPFFRRLSIPLPPIDQQKAAAAQLLAADADIVRNQVEVRKQQLLKQGLMDDLLTGRVQVGAWM